MAKIRKIIDREKQITLFKVSGELLSDQIIDIIKQLYLSEFTLNFIFDLTDADMSALTADQIREIVAYAKKHAHLREGGKTAFVISDGLSFGLARMYEAFSELQDHPISHFVCKDIDEAMSWIMGKENR